MTTIKWLTLALLAAAVGCQQNGPIDHVGLDGLSFTLPAGWEVVPYAPPSEAASADPSAPEAYAYRESLAKHATSGDRTLELWVISSPAKPGQSKDAELASALAMFRRQGYPKTTVLREEACSTKDGDVGRKVLFELAGQQVNSDGTRHALNGVVRIFTKDGRTYAVVGVFPRNYEASIDQICKTLRLPDGRSAAQAKATSVEPLGPSGKPMK